MEKIRISRTAIDEALFSLEKASWQYGQRGKNAAEGVAWYVNTARATTDFLTAFINLSSYRMNTLAEKIAKCGTAEDVVAVTKKYLKVAA